MKVIAFPSAAATIRKDGRTGHSLRQRICQRIYQGLYRAAFGYRAGEAPASVTR